MGLGGGAAGTQPQKAASPPCAPDLGDPPPVNTGDALGCSHLTDGDTEAGESVAAPESDTGPLPPPGSLPTSWPGSHSEGRWATADAERPVLLRPPAPHALTRRVYNTWRVFPARPSEHLEMF